MVWSIATPKVKTYSSAEIMAFTISNIEQDVPQLSITFRIGETVDSQFVAYEKKTVEIDPALTIAKMNELAPDGLSFYDGVGLALYQLLAQAGHIPAGELV